MAYKGVETGGGWLLVILLIIIICVWDGRKELCGLGGREDCAYREGCSDSWSSTRAIVIASCNNTSIINIAQVNKSDCLVEAGRRCHNHKGASTKQLTRQSSLMFKSNYK